MGKIQGGCGKTLRGDGSKGALVKPQGGLVKSEGGVGKNPRGVDKIQGGVCKKTRGY